MWLVSSQNFGLLTTLTTSYNALKFVHVSLVTTELRLCDSNFTRSSVARSSNINSVLFNGKELGIPKGSALSG
jgi:hypothetical protein